MNNKILVKHYFNLDGGDNALVKICKPRVLHLDITKGIGILLIVFGHNYIANNNLKLFNIIYSFHVPLFFILAGVFIKREVSFREMLIKKADSLLKPYFVTFMLIYPLYALKGNSFLEYVAGILYGTSATIPWGPLWFLPNLFLIYVFVYFIIPYITHKNRFISIIFILLMLFIGSLFLDRFYQIRLNIFDKNYFLPGLPLSADVLLISSSFFLMGYYMRERIIDIKVNYILLMISVLLFFLI